MLDYTLKRSKRRKTVAIKVAQRELTVYAPHFVTKTQINEWLLSKQGWIDAQLHKQQIQADTRQFPLKTHSIKLFNEAVNVQFENAARTQWQQHNESQTLLLSISSRVKHRTQMYQGLLEQFLHEKLESYIEMRVNYYCQLMGEKLPNNIRIQSYKRRWGSCNRRRELTFNLHLASAPTWIIDYVIVHELAHLKYLNHSAQFWHRVGLFYSEHKKASAWLNKHGMSLQWVFE